MLERRAGPVDDVKERACRQFVDTTPERLPPTHRLLDGASGRPLAIPLRTDELAPAAGSLEQ
jgi:hypothetical protein